jgi:Flp pilus assembly pilin Flp
MRKAVTHFLADERGSAMLEYSLIMAAMAVCVISAVSALGETLGGLYQTILAGVVSIGGLAQ